MDLQLLKQRPEIQAIQKQFEAEGVDFTSVLKEAAANATITNIAMRGQALTADATPTGLSTDFVFDIVTFLLQKLAEIKAANPSKTKAGKILETVGNTILKFLPFIKPLFAKKK